MRAIGRLFLEIADNALLFTAIFIIIASDDWKTTLIAVAICVVLRALIRHIRNADLRNRLSDIADALEEPDTWNVTTNVHQAIRLPSSK